MDSWTPPKSPPKRYFDSEVSTNSPKVFAFSCKETRTSLNIIIEVFNKHFRGELPVQNYRGIYETTLLRHIKEVKECFMLIKLCDQDTAYVLNSGKDINGAQLRKQLCTAYSHVLTYHLQLQQNILITNQGTKMDIKFYISLFKEINALLRAVGSICDIPEIQFKRDLNVGQRDTYCNYVHACLDIWWYSIIILKIADDLEKEPRLCHEMTISFQEIFHLLLKDFSCLSIHYYYSFRKPFPFPCNCFQEFWVLLINFLDEPRSKEDCSFWFSYNGIIQEILNSPNIPDDSSTASSLLTKFRRKELIESCFWLTSYLATLESSVSKNGYETLKLLVNILLSSCTDCKEDYIRKSLFHAMRLISLWEPNCDVILLLTDLFLKKIDEVFCLSGMEMRNFSYLFNSTKSWFQYITKMLSPCAILTTETSFDIFLQIIAKQLAKDSVDKSLWRSLKGRIYSKLTTKKFRELTEVGLQNCFSLFLSIAESGKLEVTDKVCELSNVVEVTSNPKKQSISWRAMFVLMHIHQKQGSKLNKIISKISKFFNDMCVRFSKITRDSMEKSNVMNLLLIYINGMGEIFEQSNNLSLSEYQLIGSGFSILFSSCGITELNYILNVFSNILKKVKDIVDDDGIQDLAIDMQYTAFLEVVFSHIYPFVEKMSTTNTPPELLADIAAVVLSLSYKFSPLLNGKISYQDIFMHFTTKDNINNSLTCRFLCFALSDTSVLNGLKSKIPMFTIVFQSWLKCGIYLQPPCDQMQEFTEKVILQEDMLKTFPNVVDLNFRCSNHVLTSIAFFRKMGEHYEENSDYQTRKHMKGTILNYFKNYINHVHNRITTQRDGTTLSYVYRHISNLVKHCSPLLYLKGNPESIIPKLIDKTVIPQLVFPKDKPSQTILICSIKEYLPNFIRGLFKLDYKNDLCIQREIKDIVLNYVCNYPPHSNPITRLMIDTVNCRQEGLKPEAFDFLVDIIKKSVLPNSTINNMNGFSVLYEIFKSTPSAKQDYIITALLKSALEGFMKQGNISNFMRDLIAKIIHYFREKNLQDSKNVLIPILQWFIQEKLQWATAKAFGLLEMFAEQLPYVFESIVAFLNESVLKLEAKRGSGPDEVIRTHLRRTLSKFSKSIISIKQEQNLS